MLAVRSRRAGSVLARVQRPPGRVGEGGIQSCGARARTATLCRLVDVHFHLLWGIDDGPQTRHEAMALARAAAASGTTSIAATSHVSWDWPDNVSHTLEPRIREARFALSQESIPLELFSGAEVALTRAVELDDDELQALALGRGPWVLVEPPVLAQAAGVGTMFDTLRARGHSIVIAHPERCPAFHHEPEALQRLVAAGMLCSITARALTGAFGKTVKRFSHAMLREGLAHNVASDAHDAKRRPPDLSNVMRAAELDPADIERLGRLSGRAILEGAPMPPPQRCVRRRSGLLGRLRVSSRSPRG